MFYCMSKASLYSSFDVCENINNFWDLKIRDYSGLWCQIWVNLFLLALGGTWLTMLWLFKFHNQLKIGVYAKKSLVKNLHQNQRVFTHFECTIVRGGSRGGVWASLPLSKAYIPLLNHQPISIFPHQKTCHCPSLMSQKHSGYQGRLIKGAWPYVDFPDSIYLTLRVQLIPQKWLNFYGHKTVCIIYRIRRIGGRITGLSYRHLYPTTYLLKG